MGDKEAGLTLVELLATLAIVAIILSAALPSFASLVRRSNEAATYHLLRTSLAFARLRAVKDNAPVTLCPSTDGRNCRVDSVWSDGWIMYRDPGREEQPHTPAAVIRHVDDVAPGLLIRSTTGRRRIRFLPGGWAYGSNLTIRVCEGVSGDLLGSVIVNNAGRPRTERYPAGVRCPFRRDGV